MFLLTIQSKKKMANGLKTHHRLLNLKKAFQMKLKSYALPSLFQFLNLSGAKARGFDKEYLSAWFVAFKTVGLNETFTDECSFTGVGLENYLNGWCDYTYVILPDKEGFRIFIYDYQLNFIDEIHSSDCLKDLEAEEWWY